MKDFDDWYCESRNIRNINAMSIIENLAQRYFGVTAEEGIWLAECGEIPDFLFVSRIRMLASLIRYGEEEK